MSRDSQPREFLRSAVIALAFSFWISPTDAVGAGAGKTSSAVAKDEVSCTCEDHSCKPCEIETNVTFYTAKCGPENSRVKSCKRPTCEPVADQKRCFSDLAAKAADAAGGKSGSDGVVPAAASAALATSSPPIPIGTVTDVVGKAKLTHDGGTSGSETIRIGIPVYEGDTVETTEQAKVRIALNDDNVLNVQPASKVIIQEQKAERGTDRRRTLLNLMYGKLRAKVNKENKYDGKRNIFEVRTKSAVAGVRGTDFVTSFEAGSKKWVSEVRTLEGVVNFGGEDWADPLKIEKGHAATFTIDSPPGEITDIQLKAFIRKGELSRPRQLSDDELVRTDRETELPRVSESAADSASVRGPATTADVVCLQPSAQMGQCSFACEGNPTGQARCRTDLPGVRCVRRLCNAAGKWADPTILSPRTGAFCQPGPTQVRDCGDY